MVGTGWGYVTVGTCYYSYCDSITRTFEHLYVV